MTQINICSIFIWAVWIVCASTELESDRCSKMRQLDLTQLYSYFQCAQHQFTNNWVTTELNSVGVPVVALYAPHTSVTDWMGLNVCCTKWNWISSNGDCNFWTYLMSCDGASMGSQVNGRVRESFWIVLKIRLKCYTPKVFLPFH